MAANPQKNTLSGLARALVQANRIKESEADALLTQALATQTSFIQQLIASHKLNAAEIARFASDTFGYPCLISTPSTITKSLQRQSIAS